MYRKFFLVFAGAAATLFSLAAAVNAIADPYDVWGIYRKVGFNMYSPKVEEVERLAKPIDFLHFAPQPEVVFLGTSQVLHGIDADAYRGMTGQPSYNFALRGATLYEQRRCLEHVLAADPELKEVIIGLTYALFIDGDHYVLEKEAPAFLDNEAQYGTTHLTGTNLAKTLLSSDALRDSLKKIRLNRKQPRTHSYCMASGKVYDGSMLDFCQRDYWHFNRTLTRMQQAGNYVGPRRKESSYEELRRMLALCEAHGVKVRLFIPAVHARQMEVMADSWEAYEDWRRELVQLAPVMDFTGYNDVTMSPAAEGVITADTNPYFWDTMHVKTELGNAMLARLAGAPGADAAFGVLLTPENVEAHLEALRIGREAWEAAHPESMEEVRYYSRFSQAVPQALAHEGLAYGQGIVQLQEAGAEKHVFGDDWRLEPAAFSKQKPLSIVLGTENRLFVHGSYLAPPGRLRAVYAVLEDASGQRRYALTEWARSPKAAEFMRNQGYAERGFRMEMPMWNMPSGTYRLSFVEVTEDGAAYASGTLGEVTVREQGGEAGLVG